MVHARHERATTFGTETLIVADTGEYLILQEHRLGRPRGRPKKDPEERAIEVEPPAPKPKRKRRSGRGPKGRRRCAKCLKFFEPGQPYEEHFAQCKSKAGQRVCPYCKETFISNNLHSHVAMHERRGDKLPK